MTRREEKMILARDGAEVLRCRRVREALDRRFKTLDEIFDHFDELERKRVRELAAPRRARRGKAVAVRNGSAPKAKSQPSRARAQSAALARS